MELSKTKASLYATLSAKKMRQRYGLFLAEGEKCVLDTLGAFPLECLIATPEWLNDNNTKVADYSDKLAMATEAVIRKITMLVTPPEVIAVFKIPETEDCPIVRDELYLMLDGVQDPGNLGTIIRTADWFGVNVIFASNDTVDVFNPKVVQSTMGSLKRVKVIYCDLLKMMESNKGMPVYGMLLDGENIYNLDKRNEGGFIVMGNEGNGISKEIRKYINHSLLIPPYNRNSHPESLNVAVATAITLSWFRGNHSA